MDEPRAGGLIDKSYLKFILGIALCFYLGFQLINFTLNKVRDVNIMLYGIHQEEPSIIFYNSCDGYVQDYYNCNGGRFENLTGKYCNNTIVCQRSYKILR